MSGRRWVTSRSAVSRSIETPESETSKPGLLAALIQHAGRVNMIWADAYLVIDDSAILTNRLQAALLHICCQI